MPFSIVDRFTNVVPASFSTDGLNIRHREMTLFTLGKTPVTVAGLIDFVLIILVGLVARNLILRAFRKKIELQSTPQGRHLMGLFSSAAGYLVLVLTALIALDNLGIRITSLQGLLGLIGLGFGIGFQSVAANIIAMFVILTEKSIQVGDLIEIDGILGHITEIRTRSTTIMSRDNVAIIIPNSHFITNKVINWSHLDRKVRLHLKVGVAMDVTKLDLARNTMLETAAAHPEVLDAPEPVVWFTGFGDSSFDLELVFWVRDGTLRHTVVSDLNFSLAEKFRSLGIELPYPSRTIYVREGLVPGPQVPSSAVGS
jgi:small-conductance mechanosensitive channel